MEHVEEYIVERNDDGSMTFSKTVNPIREWITRCSDCKYYEHKKFMDYNENEYEHLCWYFADYENTPASVRPDGFCAWAERRYC